jgi:hypothetical protein
MSIADAAKRLGRYVPLLVSVTLIGVIVARFEGGSLVTEMNVGVLLLGLAMALFLDTTWGAFKWWLVITWAGVEARFVEIWRLWVGLLPATFFAPFQSGHLLYGIALRNARGLSTFKAFEIVAYDKWSTLVGTFALIAVGQAVIPSDHFAAHPLVLIGAVGVVGLFLVDQVVFGFLGRFRFFSEASTLLHHPFTLRRKVCLLLLATVYQSSDVVSMAVSCWALGLDVPIEMVVGVFPIILLLTYVPISVSGFGVRENLIVLFFGGVLTFEQAISTGFGVDFLEYVAPAFFGVIALPVTLRTLWRWRRESGDGTKDEDSSSEQGPPAGP